MIKKNKAPICFAFLFFLISACNLITQNEIEDPVARVGEKYITKTELLKHIPKDASKADSALIANAYINDWATKQLLMEGALLNLPQVKQTELNLLVEQYKNDLYTKSYLEGLVTKNIDKNVSQQEALKFLEDNKESFKLNEELLKLRYISLANTSLNIDDIIQKFKTFENKDKVVLDSISVQFKSYSLNDSTWVKASDAIKKIEVLSNEDKPILLKKSNFIERKDSINLYLILIKDVKKRNDYAPIEYVRPTLNQIIINKRKLELIKKLKSDITKDAIENKTFETYN